MLKSKKHVFWEALFVTIVIFLIGLLIGISLEKDRSNTIENYYSQSEVSLIDLMALQKSAEIERFDCEDLIKRNLEFADKIYQEAKLLEDYESANQLTQNLINSHKKYDVLRTLVWLNILKLESNCKEDFNLIIYLYEYQTEDLEQKAKQKVWSNILYDLKLNQAENLILVPIATDMNLSSVDVLITEFQPEKYPAVIINNNHILYDISSVDKLEKLLN